MPNKDKNDRTIARYLDNLEYTFNWGDYTDNEEVNTILAKSSKNGDGNIGKPDHIYVNENKKILILIEDKPKIKEHESSPYKEKYVDTCILKALMNSKIKEKKNKTNAFDDNEKYNPVKYATDGIIWYLSFFKKKNIDNDILKNYFIDWRIIGIAISGDINDLYNHKISTYILIGDKIIEQTQVKKINNEEDYINLFNNMVEESLIDSIASSSKKINKLLRSIDSQKRPILLSALMICLFEYDDNDIDNSFVTQYKTWKPKSIAEKIPDRVNDILKAEKIPEGKRNVIKAELEFVKVDNTLVNSKILIDILDELKVNVISKFRITSNYDIIGKFYEEFLRYAGVANVKKGIVLTPHHITTLFTELIPMEADDVIIDSCCGTGSFLIAGMNKIIDINKEIQEYKTKVLIDEIDKIEKIKLLDILEVVININDKFDNNNSNYNKFLYTNEEKEAISNKISSLNERTLDNIKDAILYERRIQCEEIYDNVRKNQLIGFEENSTMYSLAISNMLFRGDGKSRIFYEDYFSKQADTHLKELNEKKIKPTIGFINPPYGGKDNKNNKTKKEIQFLERLLTHVSKYVVIIAPLSTYFKDKEKRNLILKKNTLKYVINMPQDLFQPNASTSTAIAVLQVGVPQGNQETIFYDLKDDGYVLSKSKGRTNAYGKWEKEKQKLLNMIFNPDNYNKEFREKIFIAKHIVKDNDEWLIQAYSNTNYKNLSTKNFEKTVKNYIVYRTKLNMDLIGSNIDELSMAEILADYNNIKFENQDQNDIILDIEKEKWQEIMVKDIFEGKIENCKCSVASNLIDGNDIYYLGAKKKDGCVIKKVAYDEDLITKGNCIAFICDGDGSVGYHNYIDLDEFIGTTNLAVGYNKNIDIKVGLFLVTILDLERHRYSFGRKYKARIANTKIMLPVIKDEDDNPIIDKQGKYKPDWDYMRNFIDSLQYSDLIDNKDSETKIISNSFA